MKFDTASYLNATEPMLSLIKVGTSVDITMHELAIVVAQVVGFKGQINFNSSKIDGTPLKLMYVSRFKKLG